MTTSTMTSHTTVTRSRTEQRRFWLLLVGLTVLLLLSVTMGVTIGPVAIPVGTVWPIVMAQSLQVLADLTTLPLSEWIRIEETWSTSQLNIVWLIRFPRVLLGLFVGAGLAVVGVTMQALVRNPLADPYILGISSGASVGAVSVLAFGAFAFAGVYALSFGAFFGALLTFFIVFLMAQRHGRILPTRLVLSGVAVAYFFSGLSSFITLTSDNRELARAVLAWLLGSLAGTDWTELVLPVVVLTIGSLALTLQARSLNALIVGDETAATLGVDTTRFRRQLFVTVSLITGAMVAVSGAIGFIGLIIPHVVRLLVGTDHRRVLPIAIFVGGIFLIWVDIIARTAFAPTELPVGVITSLLGGPFFLWMLNQQLTHHGGA